MNIFIVLLLVENVALENLHKITVNPQAEADVQECLNDANIECKTLSYAWNNCDNDTEIIIVGKIEELKDIQQKLQPIKSSMTISGSNNQIGFYGINPLNQSLLSFDTITKLDIKSLCFSECSSTLIEIQKCAEVTINDIKFISTLGTSPPFQFTDSSVISMTFFPDPDFPKVNNLSNASETQYSHVIVDNSNIILDGLPSGSEICALNCALLRLKNNSNATVKGSHFTLKTNIILTSQLASFAVVESICSLSFIKSSIKQEHPQQILEQRIPLVLSQNSNHIILKQALIEVSPLATSTALLMTDANQNSSYLDSETVVANDSPSLYISRSTFSIVQSPTPSSLPTLKQQLKEDIEISSIFLDIDDAALTVKIEGSSFSGTEKLNYSTDSESTLQLGPLVSVKNAASLEIYQFDPPQISDTSVNSPPFSFISSSHNIDSNNSHQDTSSLSSSSSRLTSPFIPLNFISHNSSSQSSTSFASVKPPSGASSTLFSNDSSSKSVFSSHTSSCKGGGVYVNKVASVKIVGSSFSKLSAESGGGIYISTDVEKIQISSVAISECSSSSAISGGGGGISISAPSPSFENLEPVELSNLQISSCYLSAVGSANGECIFSARSLHLSECSFAKSDKKGGSCVACDATATSNLPVIVEGCSFKGTWTSKSKEPLQCSLLHVKAASSVSIIQKDKLRSEFTNLWTTKNGGGIFVEGCKKVNVSCANFISVFAELGGCVCVVPISDKDEPSEAVTIEGCTMSGQKVETDVVPENVGSSVYVSNAKKVTVSSVGDTPTTIQSFASAKSSGGIYVDNCEDFHISQASFSLLRGYKGGAVLVGESVKGITIEGAIIESCSALGTSDGNGGGLYFSKPSKNEDESPTAYVSKTKFTNCSIGTQGNGEDIWSARSLTITESTFSKSNNLQGSNLYCNGVGNNGTKVIVSGCTFSGEKQSSKVASWNSSFIFAQNLQSLKVGDYTNNQMQQNLNSQSQTLIENNFNDAVKTSFSNLWSSAPSGGILAQNVEEVEISGVSFTSVYGSKGSCIYIDRLQSSDSPLRSVIIEGCKMTGVAVEGEQEPLKLGPMVLIKGSLDVIIRSKDVQSEKIPNTIQRHSSSQKGGGIFVDEVNNLSISSISLSSLKALSGGGFYIGSHVRDITINDLTIEHCEATGTSNTHHGGGGVICSYADILNNDPISISLTDVSVKLCSIDQSSGAEGECLWISRSVNLEKCSFVRSARENGSCVELKGEGSSATAHLKGCTFIGSWDKAQAKGTASALLNVESFGKLVIEPDASVAPKVHSLFSSHWSAGVCGGIHIKNVESVFIGESNFIGIFGSKGSCVFHEEKDNKTQMKKCVIQSCVATGINNNEDSQPENCGSLFYLHGIEKLEFSSLINNIRSKASSFASSANGGAINVDQVGNLLIENWSFQKISACMGGAIFIGSLVQNINLSSLSITSCFTSDSANSYGGALYISKRSSLKNDESAITNLTNSQFIDCEAKGEKGVAGGMACFQSIKVERCQFSGCSGHFSSGVLLDGSNSSDMTATFIDCEFRGKWNSNESKASDSSLLVVSQIDSLILTEGNGSVNSIGTIMENHYSSTKAGGILMENVKKMSLSHIEFSNVFGQRGCCICIERKSDTDSFMESFLFEYFSIEGNGLSNDTTITSGSLIYVKGVQSVTLRYAKDGELNSTIKNHYSQNFGGALFVDEVNTLSLSRLYFESLSASSGGAVYVGSSVLKVTIKECSAMNCSANGLNGNGGAINIQATKAKENDQLSDAIVNELIFTDCTVTSDGEGEALWSGRTTAISNCEFNGGDAMQKSLVCLNGSSSSDICCSIDSSTFRGTWEPSVTRKSRQPLLLAISIKSLDVKSSGGYTTFQNCYSSSNAGGIQLLSVDNAEFSEVKFKSVFGKEGCCICSQLKDNTSTLTTSFKIDGCDFVGVDEEIEEPDEIGSLLSIHSVKDFSIIVEDCQTKFLNHISTTQNGGALFIDQVETVDISNATVSKASAVIGGGFYFGGNVAKISIVNCIFTECSSDANIDGDGAGIAFSAISHTLSSIATVSPISISGLKMSGCSVHKSSANKSECISCKRSIVAKGCSFYKSSNQNGALITLNGSLTEAMNASFEGCTFDGNYSSKNNFISNDVLVLACFLSRLEFIAHSMFVDHASTSVSGGIFANQVSKLFLSKVSFSDVVGACGCGIVATSDALSNDTLDTLSVHECGFLKSDEFLPDVNKYGPYIYARKYTNVKIKGDENDQSHMIGSSSNQKSAGITVESVQSLSVENIQFRNLHSFEGAALWIDSSTITVSITNCIFQGCSANGEKQMTGKGGAIFLSEFSSSLSDFSPAITTISNVTFADCSAKSSSQNNSKGGAVYSLRSVNFVNSAIYQCSSDIGTGIAIERISDIPVTLTIQNPNAYGLLNGQEEKASGGALIHVKNLTKVLLTCDQPGASQLSSQESNSDAGGIELYRCIECIYENITFTDLFGKYGNAIYQSNEGLDTVNGKGTMHFIGCKCYTSGVNAIGHNSVYFVHFNYVEELIFESKLKSIAYFFNENPSVSGGGIFINKSNSVTIKSVSFCNLTSEIGGGLHVSASNFHILLENTTFMNCKARHGDGGGIAILSSSDSNFVSSKRINDDNLCVLKNVIFTECVADMSGGGMIVNCNVEIENSFFTHCTSQNGCAAFFSGKECSSFPRVDIKGVKFTGKYVTAGPKDPSAFIVAQRLTFLSISSSEVQKTSFLTHWSGSSGGAIEVCDIDNIVIKDVTYSNVFARDGCIFFHTEGTRGVTTASTILQDITFDGNSNSQVDIPSDTGPLIFIRGVKDISITSSIEYPQALLSFANHNSFISCAGISVDKVSSFQLSNIKFKNLSNFYSKDETNAGGAIYIGSDVSQINLLNVEFENCSSATKGGAIYICKYSSATEYEKDISMYRIRFSNVKATKDGACIFSQRYVGLSSVSVTNAIVSDTSENEGDFHAFFAIKLSEGDARIEGNVSLTDFDIVSGNKDSKDVSASEIFACSNIDKVSIIGKSKASSFKNHVSTSISSLFRLDKVKSFSFINSQVDSVCSKNGNVLVIPSTCVLVTIQNVNFTNCSSSLDGGSIYLDPYSTQLFPHSSIYDFQLLDSSADISQCRFIGSSSGGKGGGICSHRSTSFSSLSFCDCKAEVDGMSLYAGCDNSKLFYSKPEIFKAKDRLKRKVSTKVYLPSISLQCCSFDNRGLLKQSGVKFHLPMVSIDGCNRLTTEGGMPQNDDNYLTFSNYDATQSSFSDDSKACGAALRIANVNEVKIGRSSFTNLSAFAGPAIFLSKPNCENVEFSAVCKDCTASKKGGAVYILFDKASAINISGNSLFQNCSTIRNDGKGGAIYIASISDASCVVSIDGATFTNCHSSRGGAIFLLAGIVNKWVETRIEHSTFIHNTADEEGGAIAVAHGLKTESEKWLPNFSELLGYLHSERNIHSNDDKAAVILNGCFFSENSCYSVLPNNFRRNATFLSNSRKISLGVESNQFSRNTTALNNLSSALFLNDRHNQAGKWVTFPCGGALSVNGQAKKSNGDGTLTVSISSSNITESKNGAIVAKSGVEIDIDEFSEFNDNSFTYHGIQSSLDIGCSSSKVMLKEPSQDISESSMLCDDICAQATQKDKSVKQCGIKPVEKLECNVSNVKQKEYPILPQLTFKGNNIQPFNPILVISLTNSIPIINSLHKSLAGSKFNCNHNLSLSLLQRLNESDAILQVPLVAELDSADPSSYVLTTEGSLNISTLSEKPPSILYFFISCDGGVSFSSSSVSFRFEPDTPSDNGKRKLYTILAISVPCSIILIGIIIFIIIFVKKRSSRKNQWKKFNEYARSVLINEQSSSYASYFD
ncbi:uncharacterized protein MONOS_2430 [Monocercomonoides exilis]|uniref:uncharacterized protein n=1 Tax=Monocercomonoides exilis TaxID=2049356 RepID=UPI003559A30B|nr:hypothetical protein MONOS_2430 [Monocercomonoides exilis]|eukprot:MONOS_2430.1-p1 / transcript=MONOS_2430.1 / gene=MONOS_2430 / organism=Monocercomonoides_exilis_PA203 / gene_product=unspecified product / transcript_product=unspecified product / location=Mono_scaffold00050:44938-56536(+) / protein_length=3845 / sequence_SO=supercontig / SO=protein_coding / is_pseudo=false